ncbi:MAG: type I phosphomannose isomerase catalytic subunit [Clostridium sp.]|nr:type I phosphomannose isomerase catalytic subunit [Clostridium sp.]
MYPMKLKPVYDKTIWANDRLTTMRGLEETGMGTCWEISAHPHAKNVILNGEYAGKTLDELIKTDPTAILGEKELHQMLRLAYLDAAEDLSIQVHPYDEYAREHEHDEGKTESWYILQADKGAALVAGTTASDAAVIKEAVACDEVEKYVRKVEVEAGDFVCIDAGMLHALGKGILALEIGQNSNTTYRFYDYHRKDASGKERELHIEKCFDVADFSLHCNKIASPFPTTGHTEEKMLVDRREFSVRLVDVAESYVLPKDEKRFYCLSNVSADCAIRYQGKELSFAFTENIFVPAGCDDIEIIGKARILISFVR